MTDDQEKLLKQIAKDNKEMYDFFYKPPITGQSNRAEQLDKLLSLSRGTTFAGKLFLGACGIIVTVSTAWIALKTNLRG